MRKPLTDISERLFGAWVLHSLREAVVLPRCYPYYKSHEGDELNLTSS
jgi:hypothetical protein